MKKLEAIYITIPYSTIRNLTELVEIPEYNFNLLIDSVEIEEELLFAFITKIKNQFIISLSEKIFESDKSIDIYPLLYTLFTLSNYKTGKPFILVFSEAERYIQSIDKIKEYFHQAGEKDFDFLFYTYGQENIGNGEILISTVSEINKDGKLFFENPFNNKTSWVFLLLNSDKSIIENIQSFRAMLQSSHYLKYFFDFVDKKNNLLWEAYKSDLWKRRATLYLSFIPLSKKIGEQQYEDIRKWYNNEYEVLPIWYKRVGHVLKVLVGKRSFKSLFGDKIK